MAVTYEQIKAMFPESDDRAIEQVVQQLSQVGFNLDGTFDDTITPAYEENRADLRRQIDVQREANNKRNLNAAIGSYWNPKNYDRSVQRGDKAVADIRQNADTDWSQQKSALQSKIDNLRAMKKDNQAGLETVTSVIDSQTRRITESDKKDPNSSVSVQARSNAKQLLSAMNLDPALVDGLSAHAIETQLPFLKDSHKLANEDAAKAEDKRRWELDYQQKDREIAARNAAAGRKLDEDRRDKQVSAETAFTDADDALQLVNRMLTHPGLAEAVGAPGWRQIITGGLYNLFSGTVKKDFNALLDQLKSSNFLASISKMSGMGSLSDAEGKKVETAIAALQNSQSEEQFVNNLNDLNRKLVRLRQVSEQEYQRHGGDKQLVGTKPITNTSSEW